MSDDGVVNLGAKSLDALELSPAVKQALLEIQAELMTAYQRNFVEMLETMRQQSSALDRLQTTLAIMIERMVPDIKERIPISIRQVQPGERPDVASALVVADPIGTGYTMTQADLARGLGLSEADVSVLMKGFKIRDDGNCAVVVRKGKGERNGIVNYHSRALERFKQLVASPPSTLSTSERRALERVRKRMLVKASLVSSPFP